MNRKENKKTADIKQYMHQYWLDTIADEERHRKLLERRRRWYKRRKLAYFSQ